MSGDLWPKNHFITKFKIFATSLKDFCHVFNRFWNEEKDFLIYFAVTGIFLSMNIFGLVSSWEGRFLRLLLLACVFLPQSKNEPFNRFPEV